MEMAKEFTVVRSKWLRGGCNPQGLATPSQLENERGEKCCMGFYAETCGVPQADRLKCYYLSGVFNYQEPEFTERSTNGFGTGGLYTINDMGGISEEEREKRIADHLVKYGITVHFVD